MTSPHVFQAAAHRWPFCLCLPAVVLVATALGALPAHGQGDSSPAASAGSGATIIVLDASGSMRGRIGGETKMEIAKRSVRELVDALPAGTPLGLVVYSHRKGGDCKDIELVIAPGPLDKAAFTQAVLAIEPRGLTPLTDAVAFAAEALDYKKKKASVILVSDGEETCGKKPCETAARLEAMGKDLTIHAVAFDLGEKASRSFACLATETGGRFLQANDAASLKDALTLAVAESTVAAPPSAERLDAATINAPRTVLAGARFEVTWMGPDNPGDFLAIVPKGASESAQSNYSYTRQGSPLPMTALIEPGEAEIRYVASRSRTILARADITITPVEVTLEAPAESPAGGRVSVVWSGPSNAGDFITVVPMGTPEGDYAGYADTDRGSPASIVVPIQAGECEIRYVSGQGRKSLARRPLKVTPVEVTLDAAPEAKVGGTVEVTWTGPANAGDYLTIVPATLPDDRYAEYADASGGSPSRIRAPIEPGACEIRYVSGQGRKVLARRPLAVAAIEVTLEAADQAEAGGPVRITWTGPDYKGDYITIVPKDLPDGRYAQYADTSRGSPLEMNAPIDTGECEIRYMAGQGARVLARRSIRVVAATISLEAPEAVVAGATVEITWKGPGNRGDYVTIVPEAYRDNQYGKYLDVSAGSPMRILAPMEVGACEIRYVSGQGARVLARRDLRTTAPVITLQGPASAPAGSAVMIEWTGPNNPGDFITIVPKGTADGAYKRYTFTTGGSPLRVQAPDAAGPAEIRYMSSRGNVVLARASIEITAVPSK
ncbi:MAG: VWA domain-containing protein [Opitutaceae bacterium]|nr:VWA domain-containing protein [Opitutaceae bacterium]